MSNNSCFQAEVYGIVFFARKIVPEAIWAEPLAVGCLFLALRRGRNVQAYGPAGV
jgi:hypothetical protein